jgi:hypothetical protein
MFVIAVNELNFVMHHEQELVNWIGDLFNR